jgi:hypothetical protein
MTLSERIGISTISMPGMSPEQAIDAVAEGGFKAIEVFAGISTL